MQDLQNKKIIITGANGGIGSLIAKNLAKEGASLILISRGEEDLQQLCAQIKEKGGKADYITADLSSEVTIREVVEILSEIDDCYMIIHAAGLMSFNSLGLQSFDEITKLYNVNLITPIMLTKAILPDMIKNKSGHIVNIGSIFGSIAFPYFATYSSSKAGLRGFSEALSRELNGSGVNVSYIAPRAIKTNMNGGKIECYLKKTKSNIDDANKIANKIISIIKQEKKTAYLGFPESLFVKINYLFPSWVSSGIKSQSNIAREILMND